MSPRSPFLLTLLLSAACTAGGMDSMEMGGTGGKADSPDQRCDSAALDDSDVCRASDGTFAAASCCELQEESDAFVCTFDEPIFVIDNASELSDFVLDSQTVTVDDYPGLSDMKQRQIRAAAAHLSFLSGGESDEELFSFSVTDDEEFILGDVLVDADIPFNGDWVKFFAGDTEVGVIFDVGTLAIVAEVSDGDIMNCTAVAPGAPSFSCTFDEPIFGVGTSGDLADFIVESLTIESDDFADQDELRQRQIYAAAVHLSFLDGTEPTAAIFGNDITDDENYIYNSVVVDSEVSFDGDWVEFFSGDTEVGVIFAAGTMEIVAEVSDGDLKACVQN